MKKKVTYLFGAGASANALPIVKYFNARLELFLKYLKSNNSSGNFTVFIKDLELILEESTNHSTIDTVAKKYFHTYEHSSYKLMTLKKVLIIYFLYEQKSQKLFYNRAPNPATQTEIYGIKKGAIDKRYDAFIAALLKPVENEFIFPEEVNIITWNYDCQFELAYKQFQNLNMYDLQKKLGIYPFFDKKSEKVYWEKLNHKKFKILHLNGKAHNFIKDEDKEPIISNLDREIELNELIEKAIENVRPYELTFSWERFSKFNVQQKEILELINSAEEIMKNTDVLVVIGYSFPFFNRDIDKRLLTDKSFDKIYIQDCDAESLKELFINVFEPHINHDDIITYNLTSQFLIPPELDSTYKELDGEALRAAWKEIQAF